MTKKRNDALIIGAALFSMFFGAGNLIFPPFLGLISGDKWNWSMIGFFLTGVGLPLLGIVASAKAGGDVDKLGNKVSPIFSKFLGITVVLTIGPLFAIPRTGATAFEMGVVPLFPNASPIIFAIIYFGVTLALVIKPNSVVDKLGKILTPALLLLLILIITRGIISPMGVPAEGHLEYPFSRGFTEGYQTMDALAAILFGGIVTSALIQKGYTDEREQMSMTRKAGLIAILGLVLVYGGLGYLGATGSSLFSKDIAKTDLIMNIAKNSLKDFGELGLGLAVALACITTAVGLTATVGQYFSQITKGKLKYEMIVIVSTLFSAVISYVGVEAIVKFAEPVLVFIYPMVIILVLLTTFLDKYIKNPNVYRYAIYATIVVSAIESLSMIGIKGYLTKLIAMLPLASSGFSWILPAIIGGLIGCFTSSKNIKDIGV